MGCYQLERRLEDGAALRLAALRAPGRRRARAFGSRGWSGVYGSICMWHDGQPIYVGGAIAGLSAYINHLLEIIPDWTHHTQPSRAGVLWARLLYTRQSRGCIAPAFAAI